MKIQLKTEAEKSLILKDLPSGQTFYYVTDGLKEVYVKCANADHAAFSSLFKKGIVVMDLSSGELYLELRKDHKVVPVNMVATEE